jgi:HSP20 family protein
MLRQYGTEGRWPSHFQDIRRTQEELNRLFGGLRLSLRAEFPPVNVWAGPDGSIVTAEVAGVNPDELDITVHQDTVTISGKREPELPGDDALVLRQERAYGAFVRTLMLPFHVDTNKVSARFERGVLFLELPRPEQDKPRHIKIAHS